MTLYLYFCRIVLGAIVLCFLTACNTTDKKTQTAIKRVDTSRLKLSDNSGSSVFKSLAMTDEQIALALQSSLLINAGNIKSGINNLLMLAIQTQHPDVTQYAANIAHKHGAEDQLPNIYSTWAKLAPFNEEAQLGLSRLFYAKKNIDKKHQHFFNDFVLQQLATKYPSSEAVRWTLNNLNTSKSNIDFALINNQPLLTANETIDETTPVVPVDNANNPLVQRTLTLSQNDSGLASSTENKNTPSTIKKRITQQPKSKITTISF